MGHDRRDTNGGVGLGVGMAPLLPERLGKGFMGQTIMEEEEEDSDF